VLLSVIMGGFIGFERRSSDRPAGVRTMGLVSLGACFFTISSQLAFKDSTMGWDASRVAAAIPSGVGFLGAGLIWTGTVGSGKEERQEVHGLTTAAGVWLSAAIGTGCGGQLYFVSGYSCILVTMILRYGPKIYIEEKNDDGDDDDDDMDDTDDDDVIGDDKKDETESNINYSSASNINKGMEMTTKNGMGRQLQRDGNSNMTRPQTMSMEGVRVALVDADELKMFEAWKRERERQQSASTRTRTRGSTNESPRRRPLSRNTGVVGISCVGYDDDDLSCSESSRD
jgi:putative Mg2+ transporter-C (MgtC) family protein